ncbi:helix-turn-helix transcriptional regulator [Dactylosporangium sp. NPDC051484]|uniref:helix-turn-helix transcriptional regulator n=1 Tax=Dactylosporangium sp. NPDC051484 TaxID=3154942 RepID=UPI00344F36A3
MHESTKLAFELGRAVRELRECHGWSQTELAEAAAMTQSALASLPSSQADKCGFDSLHPLR